MNSSFNGTSFDSSRKIELPLNSAISGPMTYSAFALKIGTLAGIS